MMQSENQLIVYTSRRIALQRKNELNSKISCNKIRNSPNSYANKRVIVKRKSVKNANKKVKRERKKKTKRKIVECDEATRLQNRARYLLNKIRLELNLIEAYSGDGWKGQSREKIKPEKELQRAEKEIIRLKLGIREILHQFDTLICTCNCANNHHVSLEESPLQKNCKYFENKMNILEAINAHLCTNFSLNSSYEDIFKEAILNPDYKNKNEEDYESDDEDYNPNLSQTCSTSASENILEFDFVDSDLNSDSDNCEIIHHPRKRINVDYKKLHDEMFGKDGDVKESSEDEEWGPCVRKKRSRESTFDNHVIIDSSLGKNVNVSKLHKNPAEILKSKKGPDCECDKAAQQEKIYFDILEKMCILQNRLLNLNQKMVLHNCATQEDTSQGQCVIFVPFAQLMEKT